MIFSSLNYEKREITFLLGFFSLHLNFYLLQSTSWPNNELVQVEEDLAGKPWMNELSERFSPRSCRNELSVMTPISIIILMTSSLA